MTASFEDDSTGQPEDDTPKSTAPARTKPNKDNDIQEEGDDGKIERRNRGCEKTEQLKLLH